MADLDFKRLKKHVDQRIASRPLGIGPGGRRRTGAMEIVRASLPQLETLRAAGATWVDLAAGLAEQGVTQGDGRPLSADRLTALVASIRKQNAKRSATLAQRAERSDAPVTPHRPALTLSPDLTDPPASGVDRPSPSEQDNRHAALDRAKAILK